MADFTKLSDVAVVETPSDTANVLIEENGVIKKTPKTAVGGKTGVGAGGLILAFDSQEWVEDTYKLVSVPEGFSYEEIYNAFFVNMTGVNISLLDVGYKQEDFRTGVEMSAGCKVYYYPDEECIWIEPNSFSYYVVCYSDGRICVNQWD